MANKLIRMAILPALLLGCTAPDDPSMDETGSDRAQYSVDVRLSFEAATTTSTPSEADLRPFHSKDGQIHFTKDGRVVGLYAWDDTDPPDGRSLKVVFNPPFSQPGTASADSFALPATGATPNRFHLALESGEHLVINISTFCSRNRCRLSAVGTAVVKSVKPFDISFQEVILKPFAGDVSRSVILEGEGRWEQTYGAPVTQESWWGMPTDE